jgi:hypothetical protein
MPGGGGVTATNHLYMIAAKDGTVIGHIDRGMATAALLYGANSQTQFDATKFNWLGSMSREVGVGLVAKNSPARTLADMRQREIVIGTNGPETDSAMYARVSNALLGTKFKVVFGYPGQVEYYLALARGEVDGIFMTGWSGPNRITALKDIERGQVDYFVQMASSRHEDAPNTPTMRELLKDEKDRQILDILMSRLDLGRPYLVPPGVPADRVAFPKRPAIIFLQGRHQAHGVHGAVFGFLGAAKGAAGIYPFIGKAEFFHQPQHLHHIAGTGPAPKLAHG